MKQYIEIRCRCCGADDLVKNGRSENGNIALPLSMNAEEVFRMNTVDNAWKPGVREQIETQTLNSGGIRDMGRNLGISKNTVISELKKKSCRGEWRSK